MNETSIKDLCAVILNYYQQAKQAASTDIKELKVLRSDIYALSTTYSFEYKDNQYLINDDYSLDDNPKYLKDVLKSVEHQLTGAAVKNPTPQSDGAVFAGGINVKEYYLWKQ